MKLNLESEQHSNFESTIGAIRRTPDNSFDELALQAVQHGIVITNPNVPDNPIVYCNGSFERMTGYRADEVIGHNCRLLQGAETASDASREISRAVASGEACTVTLKNYRKDGSEFWNELSISPICDHNGQVVNFVGIQQDVTGRRMASDRAERLTAILEGSLNEIYIFDATTLQFNMVNRGARKNMGYSMQEFEQLTPVDIKPLISRVEFLALIEPLSSGREELLVFNTVHRRRDGTEYPVEVHLQRVDFNSGPVFAAIILDVTAREQAQSELRDSYNELRVLSSRLKSARDDERRHLARELHDDLGQLLAAAKMDVSGLKGEMSEASEAAKEMIGSLDTIITSAVTSARRVIQDLRPQALENAGLFGALEMMAAEFGRRHQLEVVFTASGALDSVGDSLITPVFRLVQESLNNIAKHAQAEKAEIEIGLIDDALTLRVADDGIGLDRTKMHTHTGFGISGMQERVDMLGGRFTISGADNQGTQIFVELPVARSGESGASQRL